MGPMLATGRQGWDMEVRGGHLYWPCPEGEHVDLLSQRDGCEAWNSRNPPAERERWSEFNGLIIPTAEKMMNHGRRQEDRMG